VHTLTTTSRVVLTTATLAIAVLLSRDTGAYTTNGRGWTRPPVSYVVNPANLDLAQSAIAGAVRAGADAWALQSHAAFNFSYAGPSTQTTTTYDGVNLVVFRNASNGSAIATTYWWSNTSGILDADIVFWDAGYRFFAGMSGCSGGFYIEDIAAHEFGHALGLGHSAVAGATMYPSVSTCSTANRTLDGDDIAGVEALYPRRASLPAPPGGFRILH
jgi:hypothetical protein